MAEGRRGLLAYHLRSSLEAMQIPQRIAFAAHCLFMEKGLATTLSCGSRQGTFRQVSALAPALARRVFNSPLGLQVKSLHDGWQQPLDSAMRAQRMRAPCRLKGETKSLPY